MLGKKHIKDNIFFYSSHIFIFLYSLLSLIIPFVRFNHLFTWDTAGLYFSAWYSKYYLFPRIVGWNPFFFLGYPHNQFYPPLYSYLSALLSIVMPLDIAFKLILIVVLVLTPISFYYFSRSLGFSKNRSSLIMLIMFAVLFIFPHNHYGGNMHSTFNIGLFGNALGIMLFFFYFGSLIRAIKSKKFILPTILFSLIILSHIISAMVAAILLSALILIYIKEKDKIILFAKHIGIVFLLTSFWTIPFLAKFSWTSAVQIGYDSGVFEFLFLVSTIYLLFVLARKKKQMIPVAMFLFFVLAASLIGKLFSIPIHFYRFSMFLFLMVPLIVLSFFKKEKIIIYLLLIFLSLFFLFTVENLHPEGTPVMDDIRSLPTGLGGRTFIVASFNKETSPHLMQQKIPMDNQIYSIKGLYAESSKHARYIFNLEKELDLNDSLAWGLYLNMDIIPRNDSFIRELLPYQFNLFNINNVITFENKSSEWDELKKLYSFYVWNLEIEKLEKHTYSLYNVGDSNLIEVLNYTPNVVDKEIWENYTLAWFLSKNITKGVFVNEDVPDFKGTGNESIEILEMSPTQEYIKFKVDSSKPVPILIKISDFPNWNAYSNGKRLKIYQASPYMMLIYGHGEIELKYEAILVDILAALLSVFGLILLIIKKNEI